ncbi:MAG: TonB-dependent receptor [Lautropia sp.]|nr:TonB-dependent receptor [Lautropia sp.]
MSAEWGRVSRRGVALTSLGLALMGAGVAGDGSAQTLLPAVTVTSSRGEANPFDLPASIDRVDGEDLRKARRQAQFSEGLSSVPGVQLRDRHNFAQDLQLSVRGFGARSTFGVRGVRLVVDGVPATMPDGQGQTSNIDTASLADIQILRGPFSVLGGNASGGVLQASTAAGEGAPKLASSTAVGSAGMWRQGVVASGASGRMGYRLSANRFDTDGWRDHAAATRDLFNARFDLDLSDEGGSYLMLVLNHVKLDARDPLGLTAAQYALAPRSAELARRFDTRKQVEQHQAGLRWQHRIDGAHRLEMMIYGGQRETVQYQSIPPGPQRNPRHAGGVIDLQRGYAGADLRWITQAELAGRPVSMVAGLAWDNLREHRHGYQNFVDTEGTTLLGVRGLLKRDERNRIVSLDPYVQARWQFLPDWLLEAGVRRSHVRFRSRDRYMLGANGDDSGSTHHAHLLPVMALRWQPARDLAFHVSAGRGIETPTFNELSYRPDGSGGLNLGLRPALSNSLELGAKAKMAGGMASAAIFATRTRQEIAVAGSSGGRSSFQNAARTRRQGAELGWQQQWGNWRTQVALTWLSAEFRDDFCSPSPCGPAGLIPAGNRLPGVAGRMAYASFGWQPSQGWHAGMEWHAMGRVEANDRNSEHAPGYAVSALHAGYRRTHGAWQFGVFGRVDNLFDRRHVSSLIVNENNRRYFEPAPGRAWTAGLDISYQF